MKNKSEKLYSETYFINKVKNNFFYALGSEFFFFHYPVPKKGFGLRKYMFLSYPTMVLYYAVALYLLKVSQQHVSENKSIKISSFYGGNLRYDGDRLVFSEDRTTYHKTYDAFKEKINELAAVSHKRWVLRLDIKDCYENISIGVLLDLLQKRCKTSVLNSLNFDKDTANQIKFLIAYLMQGKDGIPQSYNNLASGIIAYIYLWFGDLLIEDCVKKIDSVYDHMIENYHVVRYVDDVYIFLDIKSHAPDLEAHDDRMDATRNLSEYSVLQIDCIPFDLAQLIAHKFYEELKLRINNKTAVYHLNTKSALTEFKNRPHDSYEEPASKKPKSEKHAKVAVEKLKQSLLLIDQWSLTAFVNEDYAQMRDVLNSVFDKTTSHLIATTDFVSWLEMYFQSFDFRKCSINPRVFMLLIALCKRGSRRFEKFIIDDECRTSFTRDLAISYLCQTNFDNKKILESIKCDNHLSKVIEVFMKPLVEQRITSYYSLPYKAITQFQEHAMLIEQIRLRVFHENVKEYSLSLNLLLNEIQCICLHLDKGEKKDIHSYDATKAKKFLQSKGLETESIDLISKLFDRRNHTPFSHAGDESRQSIAVSESEYSDFKKGVNVIMTALLGGKKK